MISDEMTEDTIEPCDPSENHVSTTESSEIVEEDSFYSFSEIEEQDLRDDLNFTIKICGKCKICIYKPLLPLKIMLFLWYGAGSFLGPFITLYFKQIGISLGEMRTTYVMSPLAQFFGTLLSGIIADKIGKSKPVLVANIVLTVLLLVAILFIPRADVFKCDFQPINLKCHPKQFDRLITKTSCDVVEDIIEVTACNVQCPENVTEHCNGQNLICDILAGQEELRNFSLSIHVNGSHQVKDRCYYNVSYMSHENETYSWCHIPHKMYCRVSCFVNSAFKCSDEIKYRDQLMLIAMILYILMMMVNSNCYRFMDVTCMFLVEEHNSSFGRERFFSIAGILILSPFAGYLINATSPNKGDKNFNIIFYLFMGITIIILIVVYKLDVRINSPGRKMFKKTVRLLKSADVISFVFVILALGTAYSFTKIFLFWYLEELKTSGMLMGLIPAASALYGLPFLLTSSWWVNKIGAKYIFILGLLGYAVNCTGYSFLRDPWLSLILEATNIITYHLLWVAVVVHSHELAPEGLAASVISVTGSIHYHIGKSTGSLIGGSVMNNFGGVMAFRVVAIICLFSALSYSSFLFIRRKCFKTNAKDTKTEIEEMKPNGEIQISEVIEKY